MTTPMTDISFPHTVSVRRTMIAQHVLTVPDPEPPEDEIHSHQFTIEIRVSSQSLGPYGYVMDITELETVLDEIESQYRDTVLNDHPEFADDNPSIERFAEIISAQVAGKISPDGPRLLEIRVWEDDISWASYRQVITDHE